MFFKKYRDNKKYEALISEGNSLRENGKMDEAIKKYEEAFQIKIMSFDYIALVFMQIDNRNYLKAIDMLNALIEDHPDLPGLMDCYFALGLAYYGLNNLEEAIKYLEMAISNGCKMEECFYIAANIYDELGLGVDSEETKKALEYYNKALEINPNSLYSMVNIGTIYEHNDIDDKALEYFYKTYQLDKEKKTNAAYNLGVTYTKLKKYDEALKYYLEDANHSKPARPTFYNLGLLYQTEFHEYDNAKKYYLMSLERDKEDYNTWYNLGCLYSIIKDFKNAFDCFKIIKYKKPDFISGMATDNDLVEFRKTDYYKEILEGIK